MASAKPLTINNLPNFLLNWQAGRRRRTTMRRRRARTRAVAPREDGRQMGRHASGPAGGTVTRRRRARAFIAKNTLTLLTARPSRCGARAPSSTSAWRKPIVEQERSQSLDGAKSRAPTNRQPFLAEREKFHSAANFPKFEPSAADRERAKHGRARREERLCRPGCDCAASASRTTAPTHLLVARLARVARANRRHAGRPGRRRLEIVGAPVAQGCKCIRRLASRKRRRGSIDPSRPIANKSRPEWRPRASH
jgi:hypothetical protein